jgi:hypothetical protein
MFRVSNLVLPSLIWSPTASSLSTPVVFYFKNAIFCDVMPCGSYKNRRFGGTYCRVLQLLVLVGVIPSSNILFTPVMEAIRSSEKSVLKIATLLNIPEDGILHSRCREYFKSYTAVISLSTTDRYNVFREVRTSNLTQQSYPLAQLTDTVFSARYGSQILHSNYIP